MPTRIHNPASSPPSPLPRHLTCDKRRPHPAKAGTNCRQVQHSTDDLPARLRAHANGQGARLLAVVRAAGIGWTLARTWPGGQTRERQLKRQGGASRQCPLCGVTPRQPWLPRNRDGSLSRSLTSDTVKAAAGVTTNAEQAEHTALRRGAVTGRVPGTVRLAAMPGDDPWYIPPVTQPCPPAPRAA